MDFRLQSVELRKKKKKSERTEEELLKFLRTAISMFGIATWRVMSKHTCVICKVVLSFCRYVLASRLLAYCWCIPSRNVRLISKLCCQLDFPQHRTTTAYVAS
jgi:hypothetical protein